MGSRSFPRTQRFPRADDIARPGQKGSATMVATLLFLAFSVLGMSMLLLSQIHLKAGAGRKLSMILDYASENGVKRGLEALGERMDSADALVGISPALAADYRADAFRGGQKIAGDFLGWEFPREDRETWEGLSWSSSTACSSVQAEERGEFISVTYGILIDGEGSMTGFKPKRASSCSASLEAMAGRLPLPCIPLFINKDMAPGEGAEFMTANNISFRTMPGERRPRLQAAGAPIIPQEALPQLAKALKIDLFRPEDLDNAVLRRALGLEPSNDPVAEGVYLIHDDLGLGGVFVQGDVAEMVAAIDEDYQAIRFATGAGEWILRYSPSLSRTVFETPRGAFAFDLVPAGVICVNGSIASLGGGIVAPSGKIIMVTEDTVPSVLAGISLTIVSSDRVTISSHLFSQGVRWKEGIPYIKDPSSQLIIYATGKDFLDGSRAEGTISMAEGVPRSLTVQASLVAAGTGFTIEGSGKDVELLGSLQATDYSSGNNSLAISADPALTGARTVPEGAPMTTVPMRYVASLKILEWREY